MNIIFPGAENVEYSNKISTKYCDLLIPFAKAVQVNWDSGSIVSQQYSGLDFEINYHLIYLNKPGSFEIEFEKPVLMLSFIMDGEVAYLDKGLSGAIGVKSGQYHLSYEHSSRHTLYFGNGYLEYCRIGFSESYLQAISNASPTIAHILEAFRGKSSEHMHTPFYKISGRIRKLLREILKYREGYVDIFIKGKINELLLQFLVSSDTMDFPEPVFASDKEKLESIASYIEHHLEKSLKVAGLSKQFGISENALHKKFKRTYGMSLYQFIIERRLIKARALLTGGTYLTIDTIAQMCGYSDASNFSNAFKTRFGHGTGYYRMAGKTLHNTQTDGIIGRGTIQRPSVKS